MPGILSGVPLQKVTRAGDRDHDARPRVRSDLSPHVLGEGLGAALRQVEQKHSSLPEDPAQEARHGEDDMTMRHGLTNSMDRSPYGIGYDGSPSIPYHGRYGDGAGRGGANGSFAADAVRDLPPAAAGWEARFVEVNFPAGVPSVAHKHPGFVLGYVTEGSSASG